MQPMIKEIPVDIRSMKKTSKMENEIGMILEETLDTWLFKLPQKH